MGRADPLETAALLVMVGHLLPHEAYEAVSTSARAAMGLEPVSIAAGSPAELLAVRARTLREAIATAHRIGSSTTVAGGRPDVFDDDVLRPRRPTQSVPHD
jgi:cytosine/adenosine deaminase-related metal-dependent hydrolase